MRETCTRDLIVMPKQLFRERYERFVQGRAWQVLTPSAGDQTASDVSFDQLARDAAHSPFAQALFAALSGQRSGLLRNDGVITATDLYCFLRDAVELPSLANAASRPRSFRCWCSTTRASLWAPGARPQPVRSAQQPDLRARK